MALPLKAGTHGKEKRAEEEVAVAQATFRRLREVKCSEAVSAAE